jgi:hypothetical protein
MTAIEEQVAGRHGLRFGGALLAVTALLTLILIMHHPVLPHHQTMAETAEGIGASAKMDRIIHGGLMATLGVQVLGFYIFSCRMGVRNPIIAAGFLAFLAGVLVMIIPATLDGFVTPDLTEACLRVQGGCTVTDASVLRFVALAIQDFTKVALVAISLGTACWSMALLTRKGLPSRSAGLIGLICAVIPAAVLLLSPVYLRPGNLAWIIAAQVIWSLVVAGLMIFDRLSDDAVRSAACI